MTSDLGQDIDIKEPLPLYISIEQWWDICCLMRNMTFGHPEWMQQWMRVKTRFEEQIEEQQNEPPPA